MYTLPVNIITYINLKLIIHVKENYVTPKNGQKLRNGKIIHFSLYKT